MRAGLHERRAIGAAATALIALLSLALVAQSPEQEASALAHALMSPYCPGLLLSDCGSDGARQLRAEIRRRLDAGEKADAIEEDLVARFGPQLRTVPGFTGFGLVAWLGPAVLALAGFAALLATLRTSIAQSLAPEGGGAVPAPDDATTLSRIQDELDRLD